MRNVVILHCIFVKINYKMKRFNSFHSINIFSLGLDKWEYELHNHNFYELIFVKEGKGVHLLNGISYCYKKGDVFLLTPDDAHEFQIEERTVFTYIKFTEQVFLEKLSTKKKTHWEEALKNVLTKYQSTNGSIINNKQDRQHLFSLVEVIKYEFANKDVFNNEATLELFGAIMVLITRNLNESRNVSLAAKKETEKLNNILAYIRINVLNNDKMRIQNIASHFHLSDNYISIYVKKHTGMSIQQHIIHAKLRVAEKLLRQNRFNMNEIAGRLGFNDASHFNKFFKKYRQVSPSNFVGK